MKIKLYNKIAQVGLKNFPESYQIGEDIEDEDAIIVRSANLLDSTFPTSLKAIARAGAGYNNIPVDRCTENGIVVFNTPGANANAVKELVLCSLILASRKVVEGANWAQTIDDDDFTKIVEKGKSQFVGPEILGKKLGVIGLGAIGVNVANDAVALGMEVYGYDPYISINAAWGLNRQVEHVTDVNKIFADCDYITIHTPATKETKGMINKDKLALAKDGVRILNFARADLVVEEDIIEGVETGKIGKYITDFGSRNLINKDNIIVMPHLAASTYEAEDNCAIMAVRQVKDYLENGNITNSVNLPNISEPKSTSHRICIIHKNVPNMLAQFASVVGNANINIENLYNKARGDVAYTMIDTNSHIDEEIFKQIDNVIRVRVIN